ncbi:hypothetical protein D9M68_962830 [compost metagenome]
MAGGEVLAFCREDDHLHLVVAVGQVEGAVQFVEQAGVLGIALVHAVEVDARNVGRRLLEGDGLEIGSGNLAHGFPRFLLS